MTIGPREYGRERFGWRGDDVAGGMLFPQALSALMKVMR